MAENESGAKHITRLDFDIAPAIMDLQSLEVLFNDSMKKLENSASQGIAKVNKELSNIASTFSKKQDEELKKQKKKFDEHLAELLHARKVQLIDAQQFLAETAKYQKKFTELSKREQIQLHSAIIKAENELKNISKEKYSIEQAITKEKQKQLSSTRSVSVKTSTNENFDKGLAELLHQREIGQLDSQQFLTQTEMYRVDYFDALNKREQIELSKALMQAEKEHRKVLDEKRKVEKLITEQKKKQFEEANRISNQSLNDWKEEMKRLRGEGAGSGSIKKDVIPVPSAKESKEEFNLLTSEIQRRVSWFATGAAFYGLINAAKEAKNTITEVEFGVTEIARVMEDASFDFKAYRDELLQMGIDYGQTFETVQDISLRWAQAGYNVSDSLELTKTSLLALNSAELNAQNATESLIGIMAQWGATTEELPLILDKINKTADEFTVTSQDLVDGLLRSSGAAKIMGLSLDETIALLTVMREASGRTGQEVGNALNSILSYIQRQSSIDLLESLGIQVFADEAKLQFRNVMEIFQDISANWSKLSTDIKDGFVAAADDAGLFNEELAVALGTQKEWNDLQQRDISQAAAGVYRRNYFIGLIERMSQAQEVLNTMIDAEGYSMQENARTMQTLQAQYAATATAAKQLAVTIGDEGVEDFLRLLNDFAFNGLQGLNAIVKEIGFIPPAIATVMGSLTLLRKEFQLLQYDQEKGLSVKGLQTFREAIESITKTYKQQKLVLQTEGIQNPTFWQKATIGANSFKAALYELNIGSKVLTASLGALRMAANMAFGMAIGLAIGFAVQWIYKLINAQKEATERSKETAQQFKTERQELESLKESYESIAKSGEITETSKKRLKDIQDKLIETYRLEAEGLDLVNGKYDEQIRLIDVAIAKKAKDQKASMGARADQARKGMEKSGSSRISVRTFSGIEGIASNIEGIELETMRGELGGTARFVNVTGTIEERKKALGELVNYLQSIPNKSKDLITTINNLSDEYNILNKSIDENQKVIKDYEDLENTIDYWDTFSGTISKVNDIMSEMRKAKDKTGYEQQLESLKNEMIATADAQGRLADFQPYINELFSRAATTASNAADGVDSYSDNAKDAAQETKELLSELSNLNQVISDLNQGNNLTASQVYDLIDKYPKLANHIIKVGDSYKFEASALEELRIQKIKEQEAALDAEVEKTKAVISETYKRLEAYGIEIDAIKDMETAKAAYYKLRIPNTTMSYQDFGRSGAANPFATEEEYLQAQAAGEKILELGELYESISKKKELLNAKSYGVSSGSSGSGSRSGSVSSENKALREALNLLEHQKRMQQITSEQQLERLKQIKNAYAKTADEIMDMEERIFDAEKAIMDERLQLSINWINEKKEYDQLSANEEIAAWKRVLENQKNNIEAVKEANLNLYKLQKQLRKEDTEWYRDNLSSQLEIMKESYNERIRLIEKEAEKKKQAQKDIIKSIEEEEKALERSEDAYSHEQKMAKLQEELAYWKVRTSEEARKKVEEINKEMEEQERSRNVELQKQLLSDKKQKAKDEIEAIEKAANEEVETWENAYNLIEKAFDSHNQDIVATAAATSKKAYQEWVNNYIIPLQESLRTGNVTQVSNIASGLSKSIGQLPVHDWGMSDSDYKQFIENGKKWEMLSAMGYTERNNEEMYMLRKSNDDLRKKYGRDPTLGEYPKFHTGAKTLSYGLAMFKPGELVFPPNLSEKLENLISVLNTNPIPNKITDNRREIKIDKLLNIEKNVMEDQVDSRVLARELERAVSALR